MKGQFVVILLVLVGILSFIVGYSIAPTDLAVVRHGVATQASGGNGGGHSSGGYGTDSGGYGATDSGGYGGGSAAPAAGGYGGGYGAH